MNFSKFSNFQQRFLMSFLGIAFSAVAIVFSHTPPLQYLLVGTIALAQAAALCEYYTLSEAKGFQPLKKLPIIASVIYILLHYTFGTETLVVPFLLVFTAIAFITLFSKHEQSIPNMAITLFGLLYITIPLSFLLDINFLGSSVWLVYLLITTKIADTAAYCAGKLWGSHLLAPTLSPKKTIEGAIAGLLGSIGSSVCFFAFFYATGSFETLHLTWAEALILGCSIGIISQVGDLAESLIKRDAQVKDSSSLPGFGGMLDVVDSLIFTTPLLYFWLKAKHILL